MITTIKKVCLVDDLGYADIGANNPNCFYDTPHIDGLARSGMRFTDRYAANPVCSPTRYSLMTGKYPSRVDATNFFSGKRSGKFEPAPLVDNICYPGVTTTGAVSHEPICSIDLFPTLAAAAGAKVKHKMDGLNLTPLLRGEPSKPRSLYWHYPHYSNQGGIPGGAIREGDYKLIERYEDGRGHLYNLKDDIGEQRDLADRYPEKASQMRARLHAWYQDVDAKFLQKKEEGPEPWRPSYLVDAAKSKTGL